jgi:hypothetical protein
MAQHRHVENMIPIVSENKDTLYACILIYVITNKNDDDSKDDEIQTVAGDKVDSLAQAALECKEVYDFLMITRA